MSIRAYQCRLKGSNTPGRIINAQSAGKARYLYMLEVGDVFPDLTFADVEVRSLGQAVQTEYLNRTNEYNERYYGKTFKVGQKVMLENRSGVVVDGDQSYIVVLFDDGSRGRCHPGDLV